MNFEALKGLRSKPITGTWYRAIPPQFLSTALQYFHTREVRSRFSPGRSARNPFAVFYLAEHPVLAQLEIGALFGSSADPNELVPNPVAKYTMLNVEVQLRNVLDLTEVSAHHSLETSAQELSGDWRGYHLRKDKPKVPAPVGIAPTQELGTAIYAAEQFAGFLAISAKVPYERVLGVLPDRILEGDFLRFSYTDTAGQEQNFTIP